MSGIVDKVKSVLGGSKETHAGHDGIAANQTAANATNPHPQHGHATGTGHAEGGVVGKVKHALGADHTSQPTHGSTSSPGVAGAGTPIASPGHHAVSSPGIGTGSAGIGSGVGSGVQTGASPHVGTVGGAGVQTHYVGQDPIRGPGAHGTGHPTHNHAIDPIVGAGTGTAGGAGTGAGHHGHTIGSPAVGATTGSHNVGAGHHGQTVDTPSIGGTTGPHAGNPHGHHGGVVEKAKEAIGIGHHKQHGPNDNPTHSPGLVDKAKHLVGADKGHQGAVPGSAAGLGHAGATGVNATGATTPGTSTPGTTGTL